MSTLPFEIYEAGFYEDGSRAVKARCLDDGTPYGVLTVFIEDAVESFDPDTEILVKTWSENEPWTKLLLKEMSHVFQDTGRRVRTGYVEAQIWRVTL